MHASPLADAPEAGFDHRRLVAAYDLGHIDDHSPGLIHWHPAGVRVLHALEGFVRELHAQAGYQEVRSPALLSKALWERSGHWDKYRGGMFVADGPDGEGAYAVKPMSCPGQIGIYQHRRRSYRELPLRLFEFGHVHRNEPSGALSGWLRLRGFVQDDSHVFLAPDQLNAVVEGFVRMVAQAYPAFGFSSWRWRLSLRPAVRAGSDAVWDEAEGRLRQACADLGLAVEECPGEGAFYGPKLEAVVSDRLGRDWQCGVVQVDFVLPDRFGLRYQGADGSDRHAPLLVHHAVLGSLERWLAVSLEHQGHLPDWLCPVAVGVCPVGAGQEAEAAALVARLEQAGVRAQLQAEGPLSGRLRTLAEAKVPVWAVVGAREAASGQASVRRHDGVAGVLPVEAFVEGVAGALRARRDWRP